MCARLGRSAELPDVLMRWTNALFVEESQRQTHLRRIVCWLSDVEAMTIQNIGPNKPTGAFFACRVWALIMKPAHGFLWRWLSGMRLI